MVSQEQKALNRIKALIVYIKKNQPVNLRNIEAYMLLNFGIRPRTTNLYLGALGTHNKIKWTGKSYLATCEVVDEETEGVQNNDSE